MLQRVSQMDLLGQDIQLSKERFLDLDTLVQLLKSEKCFGPQPDALHSAEIRKLQEKNQISRLELRRDKVMGDFERHKVLISYYDQSITHQRSLWALILAAASLLFGSGYLTHQRHHDAPAPASENANKPERKETNPEDNIRPETSVNIRDQPVGSEYVSTNDDKSSGLTSNNVY